MLDKSKLYYVDGERKDVVHILFEDDISWYVEEVDQRTDSHNNPIRRSCKKHCFRLNECQTKHVFFVEMCTNEGYEVEEASYEEAYHKFKEYLNGANSIGVFRRADFDRTTFIRILGDR